MNVPAGRASPRRSAPGRRPRRRPWQDWCDDPYVRGDEDLTERVVLQRMRNRAIEAVQLLAEGDAGVRSVGEHAEETEPGTKEQPA